MPDKELERKLDEGLALLRAIRPPRRRIAVVLDGGGIRLIKPDDVVYITTAEGEKDRRLLFFMADGGQHFNFTELADIERLLAGDPRFGRIHKSFLVNLEFVTTIRVVDGGRELAFDVLPELRIKATNLDVLKSYFGLGGKDVDPDA